MSIKRHQVTSPLHLKCFAFAFCRCDSPKHVMLYCTGVCRSIQTVRERKRNHTDPHIVHCPDNQVRVHLEYFKIIWDTLNLNLQLNLCFSDHSFLELFFYNSGHVVVLKRTDHLYSNWLHTDFMKLKCVQTDKKSESVAIYRLSCKMTIYSHSRMSVLWIRTGRMFRQGKYRGSESLRESSAFPTGLQKRQQVLQELGKVGLYNNSRKNHGTGQRKELKMGCLSRLIPLDLVLFQEI